jgi:plastocyanin
MRTSKQEIQRCRPLASLLASAVVVLLAGLAHAGTVEVLVLDKDGNPTPDAVVVVVSTAQGVAQAPPPLSALVNQEKMQFVPQVIVVAVGAKVRFTNGDAWDHHVRVWIPGAVASSAEGMSFRLAGKQAGRSGGSEELILDKPGPTLLGCFLHGSMRGYVYAADSPWTVKTNELGVALLEDVPQGAASVKVWHAALLVDKAPSPIMVGAAPGQLTVRLDVVPRRRRI